MSKQDYMAYITHLMAEIEDLNLAIEENTCLSADYNEHLMLLHQKSIDRAFEEIEKLEKLEALK